MFQHPYQPGLFIVEENGEFTVLYGGEFQSIDVMGTSDTREGAELVMAELAAELAAELPLTAADFTESEGYYETADKAYGIQAPSNGHHVGEPRFVIWVGEDSVTATDTLAEAIEWINADRSAE